MSSEAKVVFGLAPMEGVSDFPFRLWFSQSSAPALMGTPFLRATDTFPKLLPERFSPQRSIAIASPIPIIPQVMASRPQDFVRAARLFLDAGASFVDLNCGCPSPNPVSGGAGSSLLKTQETFLNFIRDIASKLPPESFSVKMRTGFDEYDLFESFVAGLKDLPLRQLTIHGRTRKDRYDGEARWDLIEHARQSLAFPVVASGDVLSQRTWLAKQAKHPTIERVIIGRGALRNPWLFEELRSGEAVTMSPRTLILALSSFAQIMELSYNDPQKLDALVRGGLFQGSCIASESKWRDLWRELSEKEPTEMTVERFAFGRTKMIWNSLRSALPEVFFEPTLLRAKNLGEFLASIQSIAESFASLTIAHNPGIDWLYSSSRKKPEAEKDD